MHLVLMPQFSGAHVAGWRHPAAEAGKLHDIEFHAGLARTAERAKLDAIFYADAQGFRTIVGRDAHSRVDVARPDPMVLLPALAMVTRRLGLIATLSTSYNEPYSAARRLVSIDHVSKGRAGWNVVTSVVQNEARNFGRDAHFRHAERYARAEEFVEVVKGLWDSWDDDAIVADKTSGRFFDPAKLHGLDYRGDHFKVAGPLCTTRSPQGHPVVVVAGGSDAAQALAARHAEVLFTSHPSLESAQAFYRVVKDKVAAAGRNPDRCKILTAIQPVVADTDAEAKAIVDQLAALIHPDVAIGMLEYELGGTVSLRDLDPDGPLPEPPTTEESQFVQAQIIRMARSEGLTIAQLAARTAARVSSAQLAGSPNRIADEMKRWFVNRAADGFVIAAPYLPASFDAFAEKVVPILQDAGLFRRDYSGSTLREHLGLGWPQSVHHGHPERHVEPEIWFPDSEFGAGR